MRLGLHRKIKCVAQNVNLNVTQTTENLTNPKKLERVKNVIKCG